MLQCARSLIRHIRLFFHFHTHTHTHANVGVLNFVQIFIDVEINTHIYPAELEVLSVSTYLKNKHFSDIFSINELSQ